jgi:hypothetical protein
MSLVAYAASRSRCGPLAIPGITVIEYRPNGGFACVADSRSDPGVEPDGSLAETQADAILRDLGFVRCTAWQYAYRRWITDVEPVT